MKKLTQNSPKRAFTLAEGATHVGTFHNNRRAAFTLAEVLITLGIIGVVAALTIPTLISNFQKRSYVSALQKSYANLANGFKLMAATEGVDLLSQTSFGKDIKKNDFSNDAITEALNKHLSKYFKIADVGIVGENGKLQKIEYDTLNSSYTQEFDGYPYVQFQDGSLLYLHDFNTEFVQFILDVNGTSEPNQCGRDLFYLLLGDLVGNGNTSMRLTTYWQYNEGSFGEKNIPYSKYADKYCGEIGSTDISEAEGLDCLDRIIEEGWKMNY